MNIRFVALDTDYARAIQRGGPDAFGSPANRAMADGGRVPCRHCLKPVQAGEEYLILAHRPFGAEQPYAETGPIFLHAAECERAEDTDQPAAMFHFGGNYILRGYRDNDWINYEVADVVPADRLAETAEAMLARDDVAYLHMRSSRFNCYQCRVDRA